MSAHRLIIDVDPDGTSLELTVHHRYEESDHDRRAVQRPDPRVVGDHRRRAPALAPAVGIAGPRAVIDGQRLLMGSLLHGSREVRAVVVDGALDPSWELEISGWPLSAAEPPEGTVEGRKARVTANGLF